jgi:hypothetical protein
MSLIDKYTFESRSRSGCSNSDYRLCRTDCCGHFGVEDDELLDFYFDAMDLSKRVFAEKGVGCPMCGAKDFSYQEVEEFAEMPTEWRWAAPRDLRERV